MTAQPENLRKGRAFRWLLGISLALNLMFVGALVGAAFRHVGQPEGPRGGGSFNMNYGTPLGRSLPRQERFALIQGLRSEIQDLPNRRERRAMNRNIVDALRAEPFDPAQIEQIFARQGQVAQEIQSYAQTKWLALVTDMGPSDRSAVADRLEQALNRPKREHKQKPKQD